MRCSHKILLKCARLRPKSRSDLRLLRLARQALLTWQRLYDIEEQWWGEETFATELEEYVQGQKVFLAQLKSRNEMVQKERPFVKIERVSGVKHLKQLLAKLEREGTLEIFWVHNHSKKLSIFGKVLRRTPARKVEEKKDSQQRA